MLITDKNGIKKNIKASYRKKLLISFMYFFIVSFFGFSISYIYWKEIKKINFFSILVFIISGIFIFCYLRSLHLSFKKYINPKKYGILKIYPNIYDIINEINNTVEYEDRKLVISTNYLISKADYTNLISLNNLARIHISEIRNWGKSLYRPIIGYYLFFLELDGTKKNVYYDIDQKQEMQDVISVLELKCPNITSGYSQESMDNNLFSASKNINSDNRNSNPVFSIKTPEENLDDIKLRSIISRYEENEKNKN